MKTPTRRLRAIAQDHKPHLFALTDRQREREDNFIDLATRILATVGAHTVTFTSLAHGLRTSPATLRFHFCDTHVVLSAILRRHLLALSNAVCAVPQGTPNRRAHMRAAYLAHTRTPAGAFTDAHRLLVRDRHTLPDDLLPALEQARLSIGATLAGDLAEEALALLDTEALDHPRIEARLAPQPAETITPQPTQTEPTQTEPPAPQPKRPQAKPRPTPPLLSTTLNGEIPGAWINDLIQTIRPAPA